jgi:hypothetical protein
MTGFQGIGAVTQTLAYLVGTAARAAVPESTLTTMPPEQTPSGARDAPRVNVYLVQVSPDPTRRSQDLPLRDPTGRLVSTPTVVLNLRYLISFFGATAPAHLMLGAVELALHEHATLDPPTIQAALTHHADLAAAGLDRQTPPVRLTPAPANLEELSRFWSGFFQLPYTLSTLWDASMVILQSAASPPAPLPVGPGGIRSPHPTPPRPIPQLAPFAQPVVSGPDTTVPVSGPGIAAGLQAEVAGRWAPIKDIDNSLAFALPPKTPAGTVPVTLGQRLKGQRTPTPIPGTQPTPLTVRPAIAAITIDPTNNVPTAKLAAPVAPAQLVTLALVAAEDPTTSTTLTATAARARPTNAITFPAPAPPLPSGAYLATVTVDGVASLLTQHDGAFTAPEVTVP